jgi:hypothetical protein
MELIIAEKMVIPVITFKITNRYPISVFGVYPDAPSVAIVVMVKYIVFMNDFCAGVENR